MAQQKRISHGAILTRVTGTPTTMGQVRSIQLPTLSREDVDATTLDDVVQYFIPSDPEDPGELVCRFAWTDGETNDELMDTDFHARTIASWRVSIPLSTPRTWTFDAWIKSLSPGELVPGTNLIERTVTWRATSAVTRA